MTDPAAARDYLRCPICSSWVRRDHAVGIDGVLRCGVGHLLNVAAVSPIVARRTFKSASLMLAEAGVSSQKTTNPDAANAGAPVVTTAEREGLSNGTYNAEKR